MQGLTKKLQRVFSDAFAKKRAADFKNSRLHIDRRSHKRSVSDGNGCIAETSHQQTPIVVLQSSAFHFQQTDFIPKFSRTAKSVKVVQVIPEKNLILLKGAVPGKSGNLVVIRKT